MHTLLILYPRQPEPEKFVAYYATTHLPLVRRIPGLAGFTYGFDLAAMAGESPYFCRFEADFASAEVMDAALRSPEGQAAANEVPNFAQGEPIILAFEKQAG
jgi:uncharacterized protein (TIGR02118 family)